MRSDSSLPGSPVEESRRRPKCSSRAFSRVSIRGKSVNTPESVDCTDDSVETSGVVENEVGAESSANLSNAAAACETILLPSGFLKAVPRPKDEDLKDVALDALDRPLIGCALLDPVSGSLFTPRVIDLEDRRGAVTAGLGFSSRPWFSQYS